MSRAVTALRRVGSGIAGYFRFWAGSDNRAAAIHVGIAILLSLCGVYGFKVVASRVLAGSTAEFDDKVLLGIRAWRDGFPEDMRSALDNCMIELTALGSATVLVLFGLFSVAFLFLAGRRGEAALVAVVAIGVSAINSLLKWWFARPRPTLFETGVVYTTSFPSGHSMSAMAIYLVGGVLLARLAPTWSARVLSLAAAIVLSIMVAFSRLYLGVHYPTDVVAGALGGLAWALVVLCAAELYRRRPPAPVAAAGGPPAVGPGAAALPGTVPPTPGEVA